MKHRTAEELLNYYNPFYSQMLVKYRKLTLYIVLDSYNIQQFQPLVPVYLDQFGAYFFVNKIDGFKENYLTKVELVRL